MEFKEFAYLANLIKTTYPKDNVLPNAEAMSIWYDLLQDIPFEAASAGLKKWIVKEKWPPTIADIREMATSITTKPILDWSHGWEEVQKAIGRYGYMREAEALASMSPHTRDVVKAFGWQAICESENPETLRAQFRQAYSTVEERAKEDALIPQSLKDVINQFQIGRGNSPVRLSSGTDL